MRTPKTNRLMAGRGWLPFKLINPKTCEVMGLELGSIHLGFYDYKRGRVDLLRGSDFKPYLSLTSDSAIPMNTSDSEDFSILTKMYVASIFEECYSGGGKEMENQMLKSISSGIGITKSTLKNWIKGGEKWKIN